MTVLAIEQRWLLMVFGNAQLCAVSIQLQKTETSNTTASPLLEAECCLSAGKETEVNEANEASEVIMVAANRYLPV